MFTFDLTPRDLTLLSRYNDQHKAESGREALFNVLPIVLVSDYIAFNGSNCVFVDSTL